ncbi:unnamed protein product, partial [Discosporangium mesarthrocarpum]
QVIQKLTSSGPNVVERGDVDWDRRVVAMRSSFLGGFLADARGDLDRRHPTLNVFGARSRDKFFAKLEQGLKVAMSKYRSIDVGNTLFGKVKLDPVCIACDRPFGPSAQSTKGNPGAASLDPLPPTTLVKDGMAGRPRSPQTNNPFTALGRATATATSMPQSPLPVTGRKPAGGTKFVYRGGFKIPRDLTPMPSIDSM